MNELTNNPKGEQTEIADPRILGVFLILMKLELTLINVSFTWVVCLFSPYGYSVEDECR